MKKRNTVTLVAIGLVAGLVLGSVGIAAAAPTDAGAQGSFGIRMGTVVRDAGARLIDVLVDLTGLGADDVADLRAEGVTIGEIAEDNGTTSEDIVSGVLELREDLLDEKVADGTITAEHRDAILDHMADRIADRIDSTETGFGHGCNGLGVAQGGGYGMGGGRGMGDGGLRDGSCLTQ